MWRVTLTVAAVLAAVLARFAGKSSEHKLTAKIAASNRQTLSKVASIRWPRMFWK
jgi:hypothetical protein